MRLPIAHASRLGRKPAHGKKSQKFYTLSTAVLLCSKYTRALNFENFCQGRLPARLGPALSVPSAPPPQVLCVCVYMCVCVCSNRQTERHTHTHTHTHTNTHRSKKWEGDEGGTMAGGRLTPEVSFGLSSLSLGYGSSLCTGKHIKKNKKKKT